jgi:hypothetical protein
MPAPEYEPNAWAGASRSYVAQAGHGQRDEVITLPPRPRIPQPRGGVEPMALTSGPIAGRSDPLKNPPPTMRTEVIDPPPSAGANRSKRGEMVEQSEPKRLPATVVEDTLIQVALRELANRKLVAPATPPSPPKPESLLTLISRLADSKLEQADPNEVARAVDQLQAVLWSLRPKAALVMEKCCFCRLIRQFGKFETLGRRPQFQSGELVELYAEIRNVSSQAQRSADGDYLTHLQSVLDLRRPSGERIWSDPKRFDKPDHTMTPQHDYFQHYRFQLPMLEPGNYVLRLEVCDVPTGRNVKHELEFTIGAPLRADRRE